MPLKKIVILLSIIVLSSCSGDKEILLYRTNCGGQTLKFSVNERKHFAYLEYWMEVNIGKLKVIKITPQNVIDNTAYDFSLLSNYPHYLYKKSPKTVRSKNIEKRKMVLFVSPKEYSKSDFEKINACLSQNHDEMETALYATYLTPQYSFHYPQFAGVVYADINNFTNLYHGKESKSIVVHFNGTVEEIDEKGLSVPAEIGSMSFLEVRKNIADDSIEFTKDAEWKHFKHNKTGNELSIDFDFYMTKNGVVYGIKKAI